MANEFLKNFRLSKYFQAYGQKLRRIACRMGHLQIFTLWLILNNLLNCYGSTINDKVLRNRIITGKHGREIKVSYISLKKIANKLLLVVPISVSTVYNSYECQKSCALTINCIAMNLQPTNPPTDKVLCFLLDKDHYKRPHLLIDAEDSEYHVVSVRSNCCTNYINFCVK